MNNVVRNKKLFHIKKLRNLIQKDELYKKISKAHEIALEKARSSENPKFQYPYTHTDYTLEEKSIEKLVSCKINIILYYQSNYKNTKNEIKCLEEDYNKLKREYLNLHPTEIFEKIKNNV